jgi:hypothetical protein
MIRSSLACGLLLAVLAAAPAASQPLSRLVLWTFASPDTDESGLGRHGSIATLPDLDGDAVPDLALGALAENAGAGRVYLVSGATGAEIGRIDSPQTIESEAFGSALALLPDLTGDGVPELAVAAVGATVDALASAGRVYTVDVAARGVLRSVASPNASDGGRFGFSLAAVPDVDGDGVADLVVGADGEDSPDADGDLEFDVGRAYVVSGASGQVVSALASANPSGAGWRIRGSDLGDAVAGLGDIDGDGLGDVAVGAPGEWSRDFDGDPAPWDGRLYLWRPAAQAAQIVRSPNPQDRGFFADALAATPDLDGDGIRDLLVGAPDETVGSGEDEGQVYLVSSATGRTFRRILPPERMQSFSDDDFGALVATVPDMTGDGIDDLLVGDPVSGSVDRMPVVYAFDAATSALVWSFQFPYFTYDLTALAGLPDLDGDGRGEVAIGVQFGLLTDEVDRVLVVSGDVTRAEIEPNEGTGDAQNLSGGPSPRTILGLVDGSDTGFNGSILRVGDEFIEDTYRVDLRSPGLRVSLGDLTDDVDLYVWNAELDEMGFSGQGGTTSEQVDLPTLAAGTYYIGVDFFGERGDITSKGEWSRYTMVVEGNFGFVVSDPEPSRTWSLALSPPRPTPTRLSATVDVTLAQPGHARLTVYDALGRRVATPLDRAVGAGTLPVAVATDGLSAGLYLLVLEAGGERRTQTLTVAR